LTCGEQPLDALLLHRDHQQDILRHCWTGFTDGRVNWKNERVGAGYVVGAGQVPDEELAVLVGDPLNPLHAETAGLLQLPTRLGAGQLVPLLVFVDNLMLLDILKSWGKANFNPQSNGVMHFDVVLPLLK
jgi:hypothetical protein